MNLALKNRLAATERSTWYTLASIGLILVVGSKKGWQSRIPYGPYIAVGALLWMFCGREIMIWYLGFIRG